MTKKTRRSVLKTAGGVGAMLSIGGVGTAAARKRRGASAESTLFDIVEGNSNFDILELALEETGLDAVLDSDDDQYTVFAPTDQAFGDLLDALGVAAGDLLDRDDLATILLYHVTEGRRYARSVVNPAPVTMVAGGTVDVDGTVLNDGQASITATDIEASNGVAHVIDGVLLP
ncbi:MAG: fasciclin domain-containing protein [Haloarculaceae archaeon]